MKIFAETERLLLREFLATDAPGMFALDSDPIVHRYLGNKPAQTIGQSHETIAFIRKHYVENGIGRWAVVEKSTNQFIGWAGLKLVREPIPPRRFLRCRLPVYSSALGSRLCNGSGAGLSGLWVRGAAGARTLRHSRHTKRGLAGSTRQGGYAPHGRLRP